MKNIIAITLVVGLVLLAAGIVVAQNYDDEITYKENSVAKDNEHTCPYAATGGCDKENCDGNCGAPTSGSCGGASSGSCGGSCGNH